jgi:archaemetzincin
VLISCILAATLSARSPLSESPVIALQPLGGVPAVTLARLAKSLESTFGVHVAILVHEPLPASAYYAPRRRYRAEDLVAFLDRTTSPAVAHVLGVTAHDISAPKGPVVDWGVFGVAKLGGRPGMVSTYRLRAGDVSESVFERRLGRVAAHELAHSLGLAHCPTPHCLMNDAEGSIRSVDTATGFCERCARALAEKLR